MKKYVALCFLIITGLINILLINIFNNTNLNASKELSAPKQSLTFTEKVNDFPYSIVPKIAITIIIDDIGENIGIAKEIWEICDNITLSIIPFKKDSVKISEYGARRKLPVMLHMPMEPFGDINDYSHFLTTFQSKEEFFRTLKENLNSLPYYQGINNHMGSKLTSDFIRLSWLFDFLKITNLFFIDSRTYKTSEAAEISLKYNVLTGIRDFFIDNREDEAYILEQLKKASALAKKHSYSIAIGHPKRVTVEALKKFVKNNKITVLPAYQGLKIFKKIEKTRIKGKKFLNILYE